MAHALSVHVYCALEVVDLVASIELESGARETRVLAGGRLDASFDERPVRLRLETTPLDPAVREGAAPADTAPADATPVDAAQLFGEGLAIPEDGALVVEIVWGSNCHGELHVPDEQGRFEGPEHVACAALIGRDEAGAFPDDIPFDLTPDAPLEVGAVSLTFGEIICLAGDYFAHLDDESAKRFEGAWPELGGVAGWLVGEDYRAARLLEESNASLHELLALIHEKHPHGIEAVASVVQSAAAHAAHHPARRYLALASKNYCHFGSPDPRIPNEALNLYRDYHALAKERAVAAGNDRAKWMLALVTEAFACHFLTDLCASGHMRTPRRRIGERFGVVKGGLFMSKAMHDEDNELGLWCSTRDVRATPRVVWRAYGDGRLFRPEAAHHLAQVQELVRRSVWEIYQARLHVEVAPLDRAESYLPVPLSPDDAPGPADVFPDGAPHEASTAPNHLPLYVLLSNDHIGKRQGGDTYADIEDGGVVLPHTFAASV